MPQLDIDGVAINYIDEGQGPPVVLVHGFASSLHGNWRAPGIFDAIVKHRPPRRCARLPRPRPQR